MGKSLVVQLLLCYVRLCVKNFAWKRIKCAVKKKETVTTQMFNVLHF